MKQKKAKLFVPTFNEQKKCTLLSASKVKGLNEFIPSEEALITHMQIQHIKVKKEKDYKPKPLILQIESEKFNSIFCNLLSGARKLSRIDAENSCIPLVTAWPAVPICLIYSK